MRALLFSLAVLSINPARAADAPAAAPTPTVTAASAVSWKPLDPSKPQGIQVSVIQGDMRSGPTSFFMKFPPGSVAPQHAHTHDYHAVVVSGTPGHGATPEAAATQLSAGAWWYQPGSQYHYDRCFGPAECVLLLTFPSGGFDFVPAK